MGRSLTMPVRQTELIHILLARVGVEGMDPDQRRETVEFVRSAANLIVTFAPDCLREVRIRM